MCTKRVVIDSDMKIVSIPKKSKNKQIFIDRVRNDRVRYDRVRNDRGLEMIGSH